MSDARSLGAIAEDLVAEHLLAQGWTLVGRRFSTHHGELDLIALDGEELVFVEVKSRSASAPEESLTPRKAERLRRAAQEFMTKFEMPERPFRFDLAAVEGQTIRLHQRVLD